MRGMLASFVVAVALLAVVSSEPRPGPGPAGLLGSAGPLGLAVGTSSTPSCWRCGDASG